ncbi:hypothetical protein BUALT_Bualt05G0044900 [Buddleja alternifolia]|uniref:PPM-type phosphatase domain-containing protein n=1 Tax=Buddleja alternifolia TaxID=168488 RepID=A0AAV6XPI8_9LAMI|nr:hypothetical protein BUALT_Bualt05G0044900 [Buddleja alternifolia]
MMMGSREERVLHVKEMRKACRRRIEVQRLRSMGLTTENRALYGNQSSDPHSSGSSSGSGRSESLSYGQMSIMGRRREMEDAVTVVPPWSLAGEYSFFAVYDGRGGAEVAEKCSDMLYKCLEKHIEMAKKKKKMPDEEKDFDWGKMMVECFSNMDHEEQEPEAETAAEMGSTAVVVVVGDEEVVVANCGDSRAVLCRHGMAVPLSTDHTANRVDERERVEASGGRIVNWKVDHYLKPEVVVMRRTKSDDFLIIATDGLWDVVCNQIACEVVKKCLSGGLRRLPSEGSGASEAAAALAELAIAKGSRDNISVIVVLMN